MFVRVGAWVLVHLYARFVLQSSHAMVPVTCIHMYIYVCIYVYIFLFVHLYIHVFMYAQEYTFVQVCIFV